MTNSFINPYSFIPLNYSGKDARVTEKAQIRNLTGKITYTLTTLSPLFIPNASNDRAFKNSELEITIVNENGEKETTQPTEERYHKSFDFFSYHNLKGEKSDKVLYEPVIPGSEMRGAIRNIFEALTDSCLSGLDIKAILSKRTKEYFRPGILEWDKDMKTWILYDVSNEEDYLCRERLDFSIKKYKDIRNSADKRNIDDENGIIDGTEVKFKKLVIQNRNKKAKPLVDVNTISVLPSTENGKISQVQEGYEVGYLVKGEDGPRLKKPSRGAKCEMTPSQCPQATSKKCRANNEEDCYLLEKHCAHIFVKPSKKSSKGSYGIIPFDSEDIKLYSSQIDGILALYKSNGKSLYTGYETSWTSFKTKKSHGIPIYYSYIPSANGKRQYYFSPACVTREVYINTLEKIAGKYSPCDSKRKGNVCPACSLFGTINDKLHVRSRVRFSDLHLDTTDVAKLGAVYEHVLKLPELEEPRISTTEFYLERPDVEGLLNWTYDYYIAVRDRGIPQVVPHTPKLSGRKMYWHSDAYQTVLDDQKSIIITERNKSVRPVKSKVSFTGTLYFDGVTEDELQQLIAIMNLSNYGVGDSQNDVKYAMKLGAAKPLGYGSVALRVKSVEIRDVKRYLVGEDISKTWNKEYRDLSIFRKEDILKAFELKALEGSISAGKTVAYPKVDEESEGFKWFEENRYAYAANKGKLDLNNIGRGARSTEARSRNQIVFQYFMKALVPELQHNKLLIDKGIRYKGNGMIGTTEGRSERLSQDNSDLGDERSDTVKVAKKLSYPIGTELNGTVIGHAKNQNGNFVYANILADQKEWKIHISKLSEKRKGDASSILPLNTSVTIVYKGLNDGYDDWLIKSYTPPKKID